MNRASGLRLLRGLHGGGSGTAAPAETGVAEVLAFKLVALAGWVCILFVLLDALVSWLVTLLVEVKDE